jgi:class 3 adenylate cyclase/predicted ATPase
MPLQEKRRVITVLFADLSGFTSLSEKLDPEEARDIVKSILNQLAKIVEEHKGYVDKFLGDGLMALFGTPQTREDDPQRAIQAALKMQAFIKAHKTVKQTLVQLQLHIGLNTGEAVLGYISDQGKRDDYTAMGDTVNIAKRLQDLAQPGNIIISPSTQQLVQHKFLFRKLKPIILKGKQKPIIPYEVISPLEKPIFYKTIFIGREQELNQLENIVKEVIEKKQSRFVLIQGEPGIGKTRLLWEFRQYLVDSKYVFRELIGHGVSTGTSSYGPLAEIIRARARIAPDDNLEVLKDKLKKYTAETIPEDLLIHHFLGFFLGIRYPDSPLDNLASRDTEISGFVSLKKLIEKEATGMPGLVMILEDLHWFDTDTLKFLKYLSLAEFNAPILILGVSRPDEAIQATTGDKWDKISLSPLPGKSLEIFICQGLFKDKKLPEELMELIVAKTQGNPLFLEEMIKNLYEEGTIEETKEEIVLKKALSEITLPLSIWQLLEARIDRLEPETRAVLQTSTVIGDKFNAWFLAKLIGHPISQELMELNATEFIEEIRPEEYHFRHIMVRDVAYKMLTKKERQLRHQTVARYLKEDMQLKTQNPLTYYSQLAYHSELAEEFTEALKYYESAGKLCQTEFASSDASLKYYSKAIDLAKKLEVSSENLLLNRCEIARRIGLGKQAWEDAKELEVLALSGNNQILLLKVLIAQSHILWAKGQQAEAKNKLESAIKLALLTDDKEKLLRIYESLSPIYLKQGLAAEARQTALAEIELAKALGDKPGQISGFIDLVHCYLSDGESEKVMQPIQDGLRVAQEINHFYYMGILLINKGLALTFLAKYQQALECFNEAEPILQKANIRWVMVEGYNYKGMTLRLMGRITDAITEHQTGLALAKELDGKVEQTAILVTLATDYLSQAETVPGKSLEQAENYLNQASPYIAQLEDIYIWSNYHLAQARLYLMKSDMVKADTILKEFFARSAVLPKSIYAWGCYQAYQVALKTDCPEKASQYLTEARSIAQAQGLQNLLHKIGG